ncbi:LysR substrate-binding domain-containing protein [Mycobacterium sp. NPDC003449]
MELHQLRAFLTVAEELHFGRAAERMHIAQPPLSRTIQHLERSLGARLFDRSTRSVQLTAAGQALVGPARDVLAGCRVAEAAVRAAGQGETGLVRIAYAGPSSHTLIGKLVQLVRTEHPGIEFELRNVSYGHEGLALVLDGAMDLTISRWRTQPPGIASRTIQEERYVVVVPAGHWLADRDVVGIAELKDEPFVMLPPEPVSTVREAFTSACFQAGFTPNIVQVAPDSWNVMAMVAAGIGITMSVDAVVRQIRTDGLHVLTPQDDIAPTYARLAWRDDDDSPAVREVLRASEIVLPTPDSVPDQGRQHISISAS